MSLVQALKNRTPLLWVDTMEPERLIAHLPLLCEGRNLYIHDVFQGLMQWDYKSKDWKVVFVEVKDDEGNTIELALIDLMAAWSYVLDKRDGTFILRNAHKDIDKSLTMMSTLYGEYRNAFFKDDLDRIPLQVLCLSVNEPPPAEIAAMTTMVEFGLPGLSDFGALIQHIADNYKQDIIGDQDLEKILQNSVGMTEFEAIETYIDSIRANGVISAELVQNLKFERMKANSMLEISKPILTMADVGGLDGAKRLIQQALWVSQNEEKAAKRKIQPIRRVLLVGISGCGKSLICEAAANALDMELAKVNVSHAMSKYVGQSEANIRAMFRQINAMAPIAVWNDEAGRDLSGGGSSDGVDAGTTSRVHGTFLTEMQNLNKGVFYFAAANSLADLAPEMLRADRFDRILFVGFPTQAERERIFALHVTSDERTELDFDLTALAEATGCWTGAEIKVLVNRARNEVGIYDDRDITTDDLLKLVPREKNRIWVRHKAVAMGMYQRAINDFEWASELQRNEAQIIANGDIPTTSPRLAKAAPAQLL